MVDQPTNEQRAVLATAPSGTTMACSVHGTKEQATAKMETKTLAYPIWSFTVMEVADVA